MRVLVSGAGGFVGKHMVDLLTRCGEEVVPWSFSETDDHGPGLDLRDPDALRTQNLGGLDAVIHLAGLAQVADSFANPARYVAENSAMQINLLEELLRQHSLPRVLIVSSGSVYQGGEAILTEESAVGASSPYVVSKLTQELLGAYYMQRGFHVVVARPFNHAGPGQRPGYLTADIASQIAQLEREGGGQLFVGNLSSERDYTDVRDVVAAYYELITHGRSGETYNVCTGKSYSGKAIVSALVGLAVKPITVVDEPALWRPIDTLAVTASNAKIKADTGWEPLVAIENTLSETLDYWRSATLQRPSS
jgi:GDP-4-dehydro-6-deoxy-D-mannose reductase